MAKSYLISDVRAVIRGLETVMTSTARLQQQQCQKRWELSSVKSILDDTTGGFSEKVKNLNKDNVMGTVKEAFERSSMVYHGIREFAVTAARKLKLFT